MDTSQNITTQLIIDPCYASAKRSIQDVRLMIAMVRIMLAHPVLCSSANLPETLAALERTLLLTELAIDAYRHTPLVEVLSRVMAVRVEHCRQLLQKLLKKLSNYRHFLAAYVLNFIRRYVCRRLCGGGIANVLDSKLRDRHKSFAACLLALGRAAWPELERGSKDTLAHLAIFYCQLEQESASLRHIIVDSVTVINHLGSEMPIPLIFCHSWSDFHVVISGFCKDSAGHSLIQRGNYRIWNLDDDHVISPADIATSLWPVNNVVAVFKTLPMTAILYPPMRTSLAIPDTFYVDSSNHRSRLAETESVPQDIHYFCRISVFQDISPEKGMNQEQEIETETEVLDVSETSDEPNVGERRTRVEDVDEEAQYKLHAEEVQGRQRAEKHDKTFDKGIPANNNPTSIPSGGISSMSQANKLTHSTENSSHSRQIIVNNPGQDFPETSRRTARESKYSGPSATGSPSVYAGSSGPRESCHGESEDISLTDDVIILMMGPIAVGKSSFISMAIGGGQETIGYGLEFHTQNIRAVRCRHPQDSRSYVFVDTPGFDDTNLSDVDILIEISSWLNATYKRRINLTAILYLHRISCNRMTGSALRNMDLFQKLCGNRAARNVILVTTMWDEVDEEVGERREAELRDTFWRSMGAHKFQTARFSHTPESAWSILGSSTGHFRPVKLQIQEEMVDKGISLSKTTAGSFLKSGLTLLSKQNKVLLDRLRAAVRTSKLPKNDERVKDLEQHKAPAELNIEGVYNRVKLLDDRSSLHSDTSSILTAKFESAPSSPINQNPPTISPTANASALDQNKADMWAKYGTIPFPEGLSLYTSLPQYSFTYLERSTTPSPSSDCASLSQFSESSDSTSVPATDTITEADADAVPSIATRACLLISSVGDLGFEVADLIDRKIREDMAQVFETTDTVD
ncbi:hypothetical protein HWV62_21174 [Athelia sp. TMB]|nr:hypothetical protein HWV62_21174 [Athelia sp. TMB]